MKKLFKKINVSVFAILLGLGIITLQSAFTPSVHNKTFVYWQYNSNALIDARTGTSYSLISDPEAPGCDDEEAKPCVVQTDSSIDTQAELDTYLKATYSTPAAVTADAYHTKL